MGNPNPNQITDEMWWLWEQLHALEPTSQLGGIYANKSGFHNTGQANVDKWPGNYSVRDPQDRRGAHWRDKAAALDWTFPEAQSRDYTRIAKYFGRFMAAAKARDPRLKGWKEAFGQSDADREVEGWDIRRHEPSTSDDSHLWHIHFSESREYVDSLVSKQGLLSVLSGESLDAYRARGGQFVGENPPAPSDNWDKEIIMALPMIKLGAQGFHVKLMQGALVAHGHNIGNGGPRGAGIDGDWGPMTDKALRGFQAANNVRNSVSDGNGDGECGKFTWAALEKVDI